MPRPRKNTVDYFSHDMDMRNDPKIKALRNKFGAVGYAIWCMFLETLCDSEDLEYEDDELSRTLTAGDFGVSEAEINNFFDFCLRINLLQSSGSRIYSNNLKKRLQQVFDKRKKLRDKYKQNRSSTIVSEAETTQELELTTEEITQSKVKESKVKESKVVLDPIVDNIIDLSNELFNREGYFIEKENWNARDMIKLRLINYDFEKIKSALEQAKSDYFNDKKMYKMCRWEMLFRDTTIDLLYKNSQIVPPEENARPISSTCGRPMPKEFL